MVKFLTPLTEPVGLIWFALIVLAVWRLCRRQYRRAIAPGVVVLLIYLIGGTNLPAYLLATLERNYARSGMADVPQVDAVVMLGGLLTVSSNDPLGFDLSDAADRAVAAVELVRSGKARALVLGGGVHGRPGHEKAEGEQLRQWLEKWGLATVPVFVLGDCANTRNEAERTMALAQEHGWRRLALVTSASHMRRSEAVFRKLGLDVTCVACDFQGMATFEQRPRRSIVPGLGGFQHLAIYSHEVVGWWLYKLRGWVD
ncbi:MAG TPA: YdcF family protein [Verrucomicrobiota bacterium]|nr:YdcF family protein [Verrucomicrobiota bacterium]